MGSGPTSRISLLVIAGVLVLTMACSSRTPSPETILPPENISIRTPSPETILPPENISIRTPSPETILPPENISIRKFGSGRFASLHWRNPNEGAVSFEFSWRFGDVPHWVDLGSVPSGVSIYRGPPSRGIAPWNYTDYCYRARAVLGNSASGWSDEFCDYMGAGEPYPPPQWPPAATDVVAEAIHEGVRLTWAALGAGQFGSPDSLVLRRKSTEGEYELIGKLPFGTFEFVDEEGSRESCYRIGTSFEGRGKSVSGDVCAS